jgi:phosphoglucosamine mutase
VELFGTDGIRDRAGEGRLAPETVTKVGRALARFARRRTGGRVPVVALGRDPRPSGLALTDQLAQGLAAEGALVSDLGELPTPAVALATAEWGYDLAVMASASHNPEADNGLKPFTTGGRKLSVEEEGEVEREIAGLTGPTPRTGQASSLQPGAARYVEETLALLADGPSLAGLRVVVDLAAGAVSATGPHVLERLGVKARLLHPARSRAINDQCGSEHPAAWLAAVKADGADAGLAFDGDGDRVLVADATGALLDGDDLLAVLAEDLLQRGALPGKTVVATVMSNLGLEERLRALGARLERTPVGDRNVAERMRALAAPVGGEASGHVVLARPLANGSVAGGSALLGDALVAGVRVLQAARRLGKSLSALRAQRPRYPQVLRNVRMKERRPLESWDALQRVLRAEEARLGTRGRILVRYSGTEPLLRIMVEGQDAAEVERSVTTLEQAARAD